MSGYCHRITLGSELPGDPAALLNKVEVFHVIELNARQGLEPFLLDQPHEPHLRREAVESYCGAKAGGTGSRGCKAGRCCH